VIQRPEQQHRVPGRTKPGELARVAQRGGEPGGRADAGFLAGLVHVQQHRIDQVHPVPAPGQRRGIGPRAPAHIQDPGRGAGSSRSSSSIDRTYSSDGCPPGNRRERS
jgi:hypothetical protein